MLSLFSFGCLNKIIDKTKNTLQDSDFKKYDLGNARITSPHWIWSHNHFFFFYVFLWKIQYIYIYIHRPHKLYFYYLITNQILAVLSFGHVITTHHIHKLLLLIVFVGLWCIFSIVSKCRFSWTFIGVQIGDSHSLLILSLIYFSKIY